jgi:hypothetical protein
MSLARQESCTSNAAQLGHPWRAGTTTGRALRDERTVIARRPSFSFWHPIRWLESAKSFEAAEKTAFRRLSSKVCLGFDLARFMHSLARFVHVVFLGLEVRSERELRGERYG